jgi:hypothetical protein
MRNNILLIIIIVLILFNLWTCNKNSDLDFEKKKNSNNIAALNDSIRLYRDKSKDPVWKKTAYIGDQKEIRDWNRELYDELIKQGNNVSNLQKIVASIKSESSSKNNTNTTTIDTSRGKKMYVRSEWNHDTIYNNWNWRKVSGSINMVIDSNRIIKSVSSINKDEINFDIITGLEKKGDNYEIFVKSNYPGFKPSKIDGAIIPANSLHTRKKWGFGPSFSIGIGAGTDGTTIKPVIYGGVGFGINKNIR